MRHLSFCFVLLFSFSLVGCGSAQPTIVDGGGGDAAAAVDAEAEESSEYDGGEEPGGNTGNGNV